MAQQISLFLQQLACNMPSDQSSVVLVYEATRTMLNCLQCLLTLLHSVIAAIETVAAHNTQTKDPMAVDQGIH